MCTEENIPNSLTFHKPSNRLSDNSVDILMQNRFFNHLYEQYSGEKSLTDYSLKYMDKN